MYAALKKAIVVMDTKNRLNLNFAISLPSQPFLGIASLLFNSLLGGRWYYSTLKYEFIM